MKKITPLDDNARIVIESENYILEYRRKSKDKITWRIGGYYPDLISLATDYVNSAPQRADNAISSAEEIIQAIQKAEARICKIFTNNKQL